MQEVYDMAFIGFLAWLFSAILILLLWNFIKDL